MDHDCNHSVIPLTQRTCNICGAIVHPDGQTVLTSGHRLPKSRKTSYSPSTQDVESSSNLYYSYPRSSELEAIAKSRIRSVPDGPSKNSPPTAPALEGEVKERAEIRFQQEGRVIRFRLEVTNQQGAKDYQYRSAAVVLDQNDVPIPSSLENALSKFIEQIVRDGWKSVGGTKTWREYRFER